MESYAVRWSPGCGNPRSKCDKMPFFFLEGIFRGNCLPLLDGWQETRGETDGEGYATKAPPPRPEARRFVGVAWQDLWVSKSKDFAFAAFWGCRQVVSSSFNGDWGKKKEDVALPSLCNLVVFRQMPQGVCQGGPRTEVSYLSSIVSPAECVIVEVRWNQPWWLSAPGPC